MILQIDNDREWIQWWIEDEEDFQYEEQWNRENIPGYRPVDDERSIKA